MGSRWTFLLRNQKVTADSMRIFTSYYGNLKALTKHGVLPISVSRITPKWAKGSIVGEMHNVAPTYAMLSMDEKEYTPKYMAILKKLSAYEIIKFIHGVAKDKDVALLCYESPKDFCHRHLLGKWIKENTGYEVTEWKAPIAVSHKTRAQTALF